MLGTILVPRITRRGTKISRLNVSLHQRCFQRVCSLSSLRFVRASNLKPNLCHSNIDQRTHPKNLQPVQVNHIRTSSVIITLRCRSVSISIGVFFPRHCSIFLHKHVLCHFLWTLELLFRLSALWPLWSKSVATRQSPPMRGRS